MEIEKIEILRSDRIRYVVHIEGEQVILGDKTLMNQRHFAVTVLRKLDRMWITMPNAKFQTLIDEHLQNAEVIENNKPQQQVLDAFRGFMTEWPIERGVDDAKMFDGAVLLTDSTALFKLDLFMKYLRRHSNLTNKKFVVRVLKEFGVIARGNTEVGGRQVRPYEISLEVLHGDG